MRRKRVLFSRIDELRKKCQAKGGYIIVRNKLLGRKLKDFIVVACVKNKDILFVETVELYKSEIKDNINSKTGDKNEKSDK